VILSLPTIDVELRNELPTCIAELIRLSHPRLYPLNLDAQRFSHQHLHYIHCRQRHRPIDRVAMLFTTSIPAILSLTVMAASALDQLPLKPPPNVTILPKQTVEQWVVPAWYSA
jgi:hypothetical protein